MRHFTIINFLTLTKVLMGSIVMIPDHLSAIIREHFPSCELIFLNIREFNLTLSTPSLLPFDYSHSAGNYIRQSTHENDPIVTFHRLKDVHKLHQVQCGVGLIYISRTSLNLPFWLFQTLTPRYVPIIRKDVDHFIFVFRSEEQAEEILTSYSFGQKIKLKLGVVYRGEQEEAHWKTVRLYENNSQPVVKPLKIATAMTSSQFLFPDTTFDLHERVLRVVKVRPNCHFQMEPLPNGKGNRPVRGFYKIWLDVMMHRFNFTITLGLASLSGSTGKLHKNGTWSGATGDILYDKADLGIYVGHIYDRHPNVDWSVPLSYEWMVFMTHKPKTYFSPSAIIKPFPALLWLGFLLSVLIICFALKYLSKFFPFARTPFKTSFQYLLATFLEQDSAHYLPILYLSTVRMIIAFWLMFALVLSTAYRGKLVSLIAFPRTTWVPTTMDDLAFSHYRAGVNVLGKGGASYTIFSTSKHPVYKRIFEKMETYYDAAECLKEGLKADIGCVMWVSVAGYNVYRNFTDKFGRTPFQASQHTTSFLEDGYIWEKRAIFGQNFNRITWAIIERGLSIYWTISDFNAEKRKNLDWQRWTTGKATEYEDAGSSNLELVHLTGLLYLFMLGHTSSFFTFLLELIRYHNVGDSIKTLCNTQEEIRLKDLKTKERITRSPRF